MKVKRWISVIAGVDLSVRRKSALATLNLLDGTLRLDKVDGQDLLRELREVDIVAVDSPLSYRPPFRDFERLMIRKGFRLLPLSLKGMRDLTLMGIELKNKLEAYGTAVLETHPSSALRVVGPPRFSSLSCLDKDLMDSLVCLLASYSLLKNKVIVFKGADGVLVLPGSETLWDDLFNEVSSINLDDPRGSCSKANKEGN